MGAESKTEQEGICLCPFCRLLTAYKHSEAATHVRGIQRETFQLVRCVLKAAIRKAQEHLSSTGPKPERGG